MDTQIHIVITDKEGKTLFDSDRLIQSIYVHVYDFKGNLLYSSFETSKNRHQQSRRKYELSTETINRTRRKNGKKLKQELDLSDVNNGALTVADERECGLIPAGKVRRTFGSVINIDPSNVVKIDVDSAIEMTVNGNDLAAGSVQKCDKIDTNESKILVSPEDISLHPKITDVSGDKMQTEARKIQKFKKTISHKAKILVSPEEINLHPKITDIIGDKIQYETSTAQKDDKISTPSAEILVCNICGLKYKSRVMLKRHKQVHEAEQTNAENPLQCPVCKKVYPSWRSLTIHKRKHGAAKDNVCEKCGKGFRTKQELIRHEFVHSNAKSSPCHICGKLFKNKAYAQMHSKLHSMENRKHVCKFCGKHFLRGPDIQKHMRIHTGEKPFICSQCGRSFSESSHLIRHERLHTGEKPYKCDKCDLSFTHKEVLIRHSFTHMEHLPFSCEMCNKGFKTKRELDHHWLVHDKPTDPAQKKVCKLCGQVFSHMLYLRYHMRRHKNSGNFECQVCGKVFKQLSSFKQHSTHQHGSLSAASQPDLSLQTRTDISGVKIKEIPVQTNYIFDGSAAQQQPQTNSDFSQMLLQYGS